MEASVAFDLLSSSSPFTGLSVGKIGGGSHTDLWGTEAKSNGYNTEVLTDELFSVVSKDVNIVIDTVNDQGREHTFEIPVKIQANVIYTDFPNIENVIRDQGVDNTTSMRYMAYKANEITLTDFLFAGDLIRKYKASKMRDVDDLHTMISSRHLRALSKVASSGGVGFDKYYGMLIVTAQQGDVLAKHMGASKLNPRIKDDLLEKYKSLSLSTSDPDFEMVTVYTHNLDNSTTLPYKSLKRRSKKGDSGNMDEILKALLGNRQPVL